MLPKEERKAMLLRIYDEDTELINHSDPAQKSGEKRVKHENDSSGGATVKAESSVKQEPAVDVMSNEHHASAIKEEGMADAEQATPREGLVSGEEDSKRLQELTGQTTDSATVSKDEPIDPEIF
ncbi:tRNA (cytosine-5-)-methyltransferase ncl1, partial [Teratosphaeriaceae sp. CCFEE 6253]